jgi:hypothetical protein
MRILAIGLVYLAYRLIWKLRCTRHKEHWTEFPDDPGEFWCGKCGRRWTVRNKAWARHQDEKAARSAAEAREEDLARKKIEAPESLAAEVRRLSHDNRRISGSETD